MPTVNALQTTKDAKQDATEPLGGGLYHGGDQKDKYRGYYGVGVAGSGRLSEASSVSFRCRATTSAPASSSLASETML